MKAAIKAFLVLLSWKDLARDPDIQRRTWSLLLQALSIALPLLNHWRLSRLEKQKGGTSWSRHASTKQRARR